MQCICIIFSAPKDPLNSRYSSRSSSIKTCTNGIRNVGRDTIWHLAADQLVTQTTHFMIQKLICSCFVRCGGSRRTKRPNFPYGGTGASNGGTLDKTRRAGCVTHRFLLQWRLVLHHCNMWKRNTAHTNCILQWTLTLFYYRGVGGIDTRMVVAVLVLIVNNYLVGLEYWTNAQDT